MHQVSRPCNHAPWLECERRECHSGGPPVNSRLVAETAPLARSPEVRVKWSEFQHAVDDFGTHFLTIGAEKSLCGSGVNELRTARCNFDFSPQSAHRSCVRNVSLGGIEIFARLVAFSAHFQPMVNHGR
jgi:hypothetical protein